MLAPGTFMSAMIIWPTFSASDILASIALTLDSMSAVSGVHGGGPPDELPLLTEPPFDVFPFDTWPLLPPLLWLPEAPPDEPLLEPPVLPPLLEFVVPCCGDEQAPTPIATGSDTRAARTGAVLHRPALRAKRRRVTDSCRRVMRAPRRRILAAAPAFTNGPSTCGGRGTGKRRAPASVLGVMFRPRWNEGKGSGSPVYGGSSTGASTGVGGQVVYRW